MFFSLNFVNCSSQNVHFTKCAFVGASLSEPHTSVTALRDACVCLSVCLFAAIYRKFNLTNGNEGISSLHTCSSNSWSMQVGTMDPSLSNSTLMDLLSARDRLRLERKGLLLDCSVGAKETRSEDQSRPR